MVTGDPLRVVKTLIIDDNSDGNTALSHLLRLLGCETVVCTNGTDAVHNARRSRPRLVLLDLWLPDVDGLEVARRLLEANLPPLLLAAYTGVTDKQTVDRCLAAGFHTYLLKPTDLEKLKLLVDLSRERAEGV